MVDIGNGTRRCWRFPLAAFKHSGRKHCGLQWVNEFQDQVRKSQACVGLEVIELHVVNVIARS